MADAPQTRSSGLLPAGLSDLMPLEAVREASVITAIMESFAGLGYARVKPPLVEFEDTLLADGPGSALAQDTFRVMDPQSSRMMAIRADMTAQIARIASSRMAHQPRPLRMAYSGDVLRVRPDPLNPERQLTQVGAELIGASSVLHDAELAVAALVALQRAGAADLTIDLGVPRLLTAIIADDAALSDDLLQAVASKDHMLVQKHGGSLANILCQLLDLPMVPSDKITAEVRGIMAKLPAKAAAMLEDLLEMARLVTHATDGINVTIDPLESRGFDYHHGIGFAIFSTGIRGELGRGGRYRTIMDEHSGEDSTGVTLYLERVLRAVPAVDAPTVLYIPHDGSADDAGFSTWIAQSAAGHQCLLGQAGLADDQARIQDAKQMGATHIFTNGAVKPLDN